MNHNVRKSVGRWILMISTIGCSVMSVTLLFYLGRNGRIHPDMINSGINTMIGVYLPLFTIMAAFYLVDARKKIKEDSQYIKFEVFFFSTVLALIWIMTPPLLITAIAPIEEALQRIQALEKFGQTTAVGAITYYFAKTLS